MPAPPEAGAGPAGHAAARPTPHPSEHGVAPPRTGRAPECEQVEIVNILLLCFGQTAVETCLALVCCQHSSRRKCLQQSSYGNVTLGPVVQQDGCHLWLQGTPIEFESDLFVGRVAMWVKGLPTAAPGPVQGQTPADAHHGAGPLQAPGAFRGGAHNGMLAFLAKLGCWFPEPRLLKQSCAGREPRSLAIARQSDVDVSQIHPLLTRLPTGADPARSSAV